ncbi:MAG: transcriptional regulator NrdR [Candidatus Muiribacterium halophilum]|uniref:Transcriptional repressor NrdR n=1 Tax=Muiribacterium halophilum TaxID=2053465 RepID=A0A2N5ZKT2_MUIH1|nr:MAG: transcriptional regulator NrdR [Candidatus Muirbacterium halophilum]
MKCPFCKAENTKVVDSRETEDGRSTRRRRECLECLKRFTTYEKPELFTMRVVKRNGERVEFQAEKIMRGMIFACRKRPVSTEVIEKAVCEIEQELVSLGKKEIPSLTIGKHVMRKLREMDEVAYIRFASVYKRFECKDEFIEELESMN